MAWREHMPSKPPTSAPMPLRTLHGELIARMERIAISHARRVVGGNQAAAARLLRVDVKTRYAKLRRYDFEIQSTPGVKPRPIAQPLAHLP
jgi:DNA-binding NtrC family response regulator